MADLPRILDALGARGYRAAQLEAGIVAGRMRVCTNWCFDLRDYAFERQG